LFSACSSFITVRPKSCDTVDLQTTKYKSKVNFAVSWLRKLVNNTRITVFYFHLAYTNWKIFDLETIQLNKFCRNWTTEEKNLAAEIQGSRAANRNLSSRLKKLDQQAIKQQEIVYNQASYLVFFMLYKICNFMINIK